MSISRVVGQQVVISISLKKWHPVAILVVICLISASCTHSTTSEKAQASGTKSGAASTKELSSGGFVPYSNKPPVGQPVETH